MTSVLNKREVSRAQVGPRELKDPRSKAYAIQTLYALKRYAESLRCDQMRVAKELAEIERYRHWEVLGYPSKDALLQAELTAKGLANVKEATQRARELGGPLEGEALREARAEGGRTGRSTLPDNVSKGYGNHAEYLSRRLLRDAPETFEALERGEFKSVRAAAKAAGIVKDPAPLTVALKAWAKLTVAERAEFWRLTEAMDATVEAQAQVAHG